MRGLREAIPRLPAKFDNMELAVLRKKPFTEHERDVLLAILKKYADIIENKKTDSITLLKKRRTWNKITEEYNRTSVVTHLTTTKQLEKAWKNLKSKDKNFKLADYCPKTLLDDPLEEPLETEEDDTDEFLRRYNARNRMNFNEPENGTSDVYIFDNSNPGNIEEVRSTTIDLEVPNLSSVCDVKFGSDTVTEPEVWAPVPKPTPPSSGSRLGVITISSVQSQALHANVEHNVVNNRQANVQHNVVNNRQANVQHNVVNNRQANVDHNVVKNRQASVQHDVINHQANVQQAHINSQANVQRGVKNSNANVQHDVIDNYHIDEQPDVHYLSSSMSPSGSTSSDVQEVDMHSSQTFSRPGSPDTHEVQTNSPGDKKLYDLKVQLASAQLAKVKAETELQTLLFKEHLRKAKAEADLAEHLLKRSRIGSA